MLESSTFWLRVAAFLYALGFLHSILVLIGHGQSVFRLALAGFRIAVVVHAVAIIELARAGGGYQSLSLCAFLIVGTIAPRPL